jgi:DNA topoisomerase-1
MSKKFCDIEVLLEDVQAGRWWDDMKSRSKGVDKWETLRQNGPHFQPVYTQLPKGVGVMYNGKKVDLDGKKTNNVFNVTAEEAALFYATALERDVRLEDSRDSNHKDVKDDPVFKKNFWEDWKVILGANHTIKNLESVDFKSIMKWISKNSEDKAESRKRLSKDEKAEAKEQKDAINKLYGFSIVDGIRIAVGGYAVQPPSLFIGHGSQPKRGKIKKRILPEDVTINVSKNSIPMCSINGKSCKWGSVVENKKVEWLATWKNPITNGSASIRLKRETSSGTCMDDFAKFEKARKLNKNIGSVRAAYVRDMKKGKPEAVAAHLLDVMPIRPGSDKDTSKEADTVGLTTLTCGNVTLESDNNIAFSFSGKSSIKFDRTVKVDPSAYNYIKKVCASGGNKKALFPNMKPIDLNAYLNPLSPGLTSKVFRTWTASRMMQQALDDMDVPVGADVYTKVVDFDMANMTAALELNHKTMTNQKAKSLKIEKLKSTKKDLLLKKKNAKTDIQRKNAAKAISVNEFNIRLANENVSLSTSKINYIDPRIVVAWAKRTQTPIENIYNKILQGKFIWSMETPSDWTF